MTLSHTDRFHMLVTDIRFVGDSLVEYSKAFERTGNVRMAQDLANLAGILDTACNDLHQMNGQMVSDQLKTAQEHSYGLLKATLAGCVVAGGLKDQQ